MDSDDLRVDAGAGPLAAAGRTALVIGSDTACDIVIAGAGIAPRHVRLSLERGVWVMDDLSGGDTRLDGASIARLAVLTRVTLSLGDAAAGTRLDITPPTHTPDQAQQPWPPARTAEPGEAAPAPAGAAVLAALGLVRLPHVLVVGVAVVPLIARALGH